MNSTLTQQEKLIMTLTFVFVVAFMAFFFGFNRKPVKVSQSETNQINYEMVKMTSSEGLYSLEGREIDRDYEGLPTQEDSKSNNPQAVATAKKGRDKNNGQDAKGAKAKDAKKTADQKTKEAAKKYAAQVKAHASKVIEKMALAQKPNVKKDLTTTEQQPGYNQNYTTTQPTAAITPTNPEDEEKPKKTIADWKKEIMSTGSKEAILGLVSALKKGEINDGEFHQLVQEMVSSSDDKVKGLGLYALRAAPSYSSYSMLLKLPSEQMSASYQAYVRESLLAYHQGSLGVLKQALLSNDRFVVTRTLDILKEGLTMIKSGSTNGLIDPRYRRDPGHTTFSIKNYVSFLPILVQLSQGNPQDLAGSIQEVAQLIESGQTVAAAFTSSTFQ